MSTRCLSARYLSTRCLLLAGFFLLAGAPVAQDAPPPVVHAMDFVDTPLQDIVSVVADVSGERFLLPCLTSERESWESATGSFKGEVLHVELINTCRQILEKSGFSIVERTDGFYRTYLVVPTARAEARAEPAFPLVAEVGGEVGDEVGDDAKAVPMAFDGVALMYLLDAVADLTGEIFSFGAHEVNRKEVYFLCPTEVPVHRVFWTFQMFLEQCDLALVSVENGDFRICKVIPQGELAREESLAAHRTSTLGLRAAPPREETPAATQPTTTPEPAAPWVGYKTTRPISTNEWEIGEADYLDTLDNYAQHFDEVNLRAYYDAKTRKLMGLQIRSKVPAPRFVKFGLRNRDVVTKINETQVTSAAQVNDLIQQYRGAEKVTWHIVRQNKPMSLTYHLRPPGTPPPPGIRKRDEGGASSGHDQRAPDPDSMPVKYEITRPIAEGDWEIGAADYLDTVKNFSTYVDEVNLRAYYNPSTRKLVGLQIRSKVPQPRCAAFGLRNRDVITKIGETQVTSASQINDLFQQYRSAEKVTCSILRQNKPMSLTYRLRPAGSPLPPGPSKRDKGKPRGDREGTGRDLNSVPMDFNGVDSVIVLDAVHQLLGVTFITGEGVEAADLNRSRVFLRAPVDIPRAQVLLAMQLMLEQNGYSLSRTDAIAGKAYRINSIGPRRGPVPALPPARVKPVKEHATRPTDPAPEAVPAAAGNPGAITIQLPASAAVGDVVEVIFTIDSGSSYLAAYGVEFQWDPDILQLSELGGAGGKFDAPFVVNLQGEKGTLRFNGISIQPSASGAVQVAKAQVEILARPASGSATIRALSENQTVAVYEADGITPVTVQGAAVTPATIEIK